MRLKRYLLSFYMTSVTTFAIFTTITPLSFIELISPRIICKMQALFLLNDHRLERQQREQNQTTTKDARRFSTPTTVYAPYQVPWEPQHTSNTSEYEQKHVTSFLQVNTKTPTSLVPTRSLG